MAEAIAVKVEFELVASMNPKSYTAATLPGLT